MEQGELTTTETHRFAQTKGQRTSSKKVKGATSFSLAELAAMPKGQTASSHETLPSLVELAAKPKASTSQGPQASPQRPFLSLSQLAAKPTAQGPQAGPQRPQVSLSELAAKPKAFRTCSTELQASSRQSSASISELAKQRPKTPSLAELAGPRDMTFYMEVRKPSSCVGSATSVDKKVQERRPEVWIRRSPGTMDNIREVILHFRVPTNIESFELAVKRAKEVKAYLEWLPSMTTSSCQALAYWLVGRAVGAREGLGRAARS